jgi:hypothetical protein
VCFSDLVWISQLALYWVDWGSIEAAECVQMPALHIHTTPINTQSTYTQMHRHECVCTLSHPSSKSLPLPAFPCTHSIPTLFPTVYLVSPPQSDPISLHADKKAVIFREISIYLTMFSDDECPHAGSKEGRKLSNMQAPARGKRAACSSRDCSSSSKRCKCPRHPCPPPVAHAFRGGALRGGSIVVSCSTMSQGVGVRSWGAWVGGRVRLGSVLLGVGTGMV